jgi:glycosyltransferase involved in cell wall biosynthesis
MSDKKTSEKKYSEEIPIKLSTYVLITPVKNEESFIGETISSVIAQTRLPLQWMIVNDGSTDRTEEIVREAISKNSWIKLISLPLGAERSFASVVHATELGVRALDVDGYQYIGLLDADVKFEPEYFERIIRSFENFPGLGLGGGMVVDPGHRKDRLPRNRHDVPGATQFFRRQCFEALGGLFAIPEGGWDALTCVHARMLGYETQLFTDLMMDHLKPRGIAGGGILRRMYRMGVRDYALGYHPIFEVVKCFSRMGEHPLIIGTVAWMAGYFGACMSRRKRLIPEDLLRFYRAEQWDRLKQDLGLSRRIASLIMDGAGPNPDSN